MTKIWKEHYSALFNRLKSDTYKVCNISNSDTLGITTNELYKAISQPSDYKASDSDL